MDCNTGGWDFRALFARTVFFRRDFLGRYIWTHRLERCKSALTDSSQSHRAISEIAFAWGFNNMSHFSSLFRERVGVSPREYRERALKHNPE
jgi:transcriptional regulator GlxA family with amidase domain